MSLLSACLRFQGLPYHHYHGGVYLRRLRTFWRIVRKQPLPNDWISDRLYVVRSLHAAGWRYDAVRDQWTGPYDGA